MDEKEIIKIEDTNGNLFEAELITYLVSKDKKTTYIVYSKGETEDNDDEIIYVSKIIANGDKIKIAEIIDDKEWKDVQELLKEIANRWYLWMKNLIPP